MKWEDPEIRSGIIPKHLPGIRRWKLTPPGRWKQVDEHEVFSKITHITIQCLVNWLLLNEMMLWSAEWRAEDTGVSEQFDPGRLYQVWPVAISAQKKRREEEMPGKIFRRRFWAGKMTWRFYIECCVYKNFVTTLVLVFMMSILVDNFTLKL